VAETLEDLPTGQAPPRPSRRSEVLAFHHRWRLRPATVP